MQGNNLQVKLMLSGKKCCSRKNRNENTLEILEIVNLQNVNWIKIFLRKFYKL